MRKAVFYVFLQKNKIMLTVVLGASPNPRRYSYMASRELLSNGYEIIPVGVKTGEIEGLEICHIFPENTEIDTVAMYLSEKNQESYYDKILSNLPRRVIFNPGTYNPVFENKLQDAGVETIRSCVLIMLSRGIY